MNLWQLLERADARFPHRPAVLEQGARRTWSETRTRCAALAAALAARGVEPGDRVAALCDNTPEFLELYFAAAGVGAVLVPLNTRLAETELCAVLEDAAPRVLCLRAEDAPILAALRAASPATRQVLWSDRAPAGQDEPALAGLCAGGAAFEAHDASGGELAHLYYTSGTTGRAKGVMLTHGNVGAHAEAAATELDLYEDDVWGHFAPMFHLADAWATFAITAVGGAHAFLPRFEAAAALERMRDARVTITNLIPVMLQRMLAELPPEGRPCPDLRLILSGGAPIAPAVVQSILRAFGTDYCQTYGMTETSPYLTLGLLLPHHRQLHEAERLAKQSRTGRAFETIELEVVREDGGAVARDGVEVGEIRVRGATVTPGYWNRPEETAAALRGGWLYTGDLANIDDEGYVDIVDRKKDMILSGGENVYSTEVEAALLAHPAVLECAVYGRPDPEWGERVCAAVVPQADAALDAAALESHCRGRLAGYKVPREWALLEELPRTGSGKIAKHLLRDEPPS